jgi:hypothetical protein
MGSIALQEPDQRPASVCPIALCVLRSSARGQRPRGPPARTVRFRQSRESGIADFAINRYSCDSLLMEVIHYECIPNP